MFGFKKKSPKKTQHETPQLKVIYAKMDTGELLICKLFCTLKGDMCLFDGKYRLMDPCVIDLDHCIKGVRVYMNNWIPLTTTCLYDIDPKHIISISIPVNDVITSYTNNIDRMNTDNKIKCSDDNEPNNIHNIIQDIAVTPYWDYGYGCNME